MRTGPILTDFGTGRGQHPVPWLAGLPNREHRTPHVSRVRYFNSSNKLILDTIEVVDIPQPACAAEEDIDDSAHRLAEMLEFYWSDLS
jgi:hypothetical protein